MKALLLLFLADPATSFGATAQNYIDCYKALQDYTTYRKWKMEKPELVLLPGKTSFWVITAERVAFYRLPKTDQPKSKYLFSFPILMGMSAYLTYFHAGGVKKSGQKKDHTTALRAAKQIELKKGQPLRGSPRKAFSQELARRIKTVSVQYKKMRAKGAQRKNYAQALNRCARLSDETLQNAAAREMKILSTIN